MGRPASRFGDADIVHCSVPFRANGSFNVLINGLFASRAYIDVNTPHLKHGKPCRPHQATISTGSATVRINGLPAARTGDNIGGCTSVGMGSPNVFIGG